MASIDVSHLKNKSSDELLLAWLDVIGARGVSLYPAQEEAMLEIMSGKHVILTTPTGSGKSLVAMSMHYKALAEGKRSIYTCPIKALVSEKFFALARDFGPENVGMMTGDATVHRDAPILCCTAEILAQMALSEGGTVDYVIMDEFHYYTDRDRGRAWQIPLIALPNTTFLLMSATMGDTPAIVDSLKACTGKDVSWVRGGDRPVPLDYTYCETPLHETLANIVKSQQYPVYVVHFTQAECVEEAQNALSVDICTKEEKQKIIQSFQKFKFDSPFGKDLKRYLSHGVGVHHAGLLPKYRLLVEKLAQQGLLKVIMGTDTLGVGVNVPIRSVLLTKLCKFDGEKTAILTSRDFKQIVGRAGRAGYDTAGSVYAQAPEHVIYNKRLEQKAESKNSKKGVKQKPPTRNFVPWDASTFERLIHDPPEPLQSRFDVDFSMMLNLLQAHQGTREGYRALIRLIAHSHEREAQKSRHRKKAKAVFKTLRQAGVIDIVTNKQTGNRVVVNEMLQHDFSIHHSLVLYLIDTLEFLDKNNESYALDIVSLVESILEHPKPILNAQLDAIKSQKIAEMKAQGADYDARMAELEKIDYPKPLGDFIYQSFQLYSEKHPWVAQEPVRPKSIARELIERGMSFFDYIREYKLARSEGIVLRYLSQVYKYLLQAVPEQFRNESFSDILVFLRSTLGHVDSSLIQEWENLLEPSTTTSDVSPVVLQKNKLAFDPEHDYAKFVARVRSDLHHVVRCLSMHDYEQALTYFVRNEEDELTEERLMQYVFEFEKEYGSIAYTPYARQNHFTQIRKITMYHYEAIQILPDPQEHNQFMIQAEIMFDPKNEEGPLLTFRHFGI